MKIGMIFPERDSEKAISGYSYDLLENIKKREVDIEKITYCAGKPFSLFKRISKIRDFDVIHIQHEYNLLGNYGIPFFLLYFSLFFSKVKVITTMHTVLSQKEKFTGNRIKLILRKILYLTQNRVINWFSEKTIVHANFFKEILVKEYGFNPKKVMTLPQAVIEDAKITNKEEAKKKFNLSGPVYLFMGGMVPDHGHDIIIKQAEKIGPTILVVVNPKAVNDRNKKRVQNFLNKNLEYVKKNKFERFVRFDVFNINDKKPEWWDYFSAADLVLLPYKGGICSGIFAHAMASETPVISSDIPFFREISKRFGCLNISEREKDYPKKIKESLNPVKLKKMIQECKKYKKEFGLTNLSKKYKELYNSIWE